MTSSAVVVSVAAVYLVACLVIGILPGRRSSASAELVSAVITTSSRPGWASSAMQRASALPAKGPRAVRVAGLRGHGVLARSLENIGSG